MRNISSSSFSQQAAEVDCAVEEELKYLFEFPITFNNNSVHIEEHFPTWININFMAKITFSTVALFNFSVLISYSSLGRTLLEYHTVHWVEHCLNIIQFIG